MLFYLGKTSSLNSQYSGNTSDACIRGDSSLALAIHGSHIGSVNMIGGMDTPVSTLELSNVKVDGNIWLQDSTGIKILNCTVDNDVRLGGSGGCYWTSSSLQDSDDTLWCGIVNADGDTGTWHFDNLDGINNGVFCDSLKSAPYTLMQTVGLHVYIQHGVINGAFVTTAPTATANIPGMTTTGSAIVGSGAGATPIYILAPDSLSVPHVTIAANAATIQRDQTSGASAGKFVLEYWCK
jgi:hypothetical protein